MKLGNNSFVLYCSLLIQREAGFPGKKKKEGRKNKKGWERGDKKKKKKAVHTFPLNPENPHLQPVLGTTKRSGD